MPLSSLNAAETVRRPEKSLTDNDRFPIAKPEKDDDAESIWWDGAYHMSFYQIGKLIDPGWYRWRIGKSFRIKAWCLADNVDAMDEVPDSSWFTNRMGKYRTMTVQEIARGANRGPGPDLSGPLEVLSGKSSGLTPGFVVRDSKGGKYLIKLDPKDYPELQSAAEIIGSRIVYASGFNVPEYHLIHFKPGQLVLSPEAEIQGKYKVKRPMTEGDLKALLGLAVAGKDGTIRASASKFLDGESLGPNSYFGLRRGDPNDTVLHENRRELRGLRVVMSFINNTDARRGNTLDMFDPGPDGKGVLTHYHLDFSASLGSGNVEPKPPRYGNEYVMDIPVILRSFLSLGFWVKPWKKGNPMFDRSAGTFESDVFHPGRWKTSYANPAFERRTLPDAFWGAKIVASFSDQDLRAIVDEARYSNPEVSKYVLQTLIQRRDKIGRYWMASDRINPLDRFGIRDDSGGIWLSFEDLAVTHGYADPRTTMYLCLWNRGSQMAARPEFRLDLKSLKAGTLRKCTIRTSRDSGKSWGKKLVLHLRVSADGGISISKIVR